MEGLNCCWALAAELLQQKWKGYVMWNAGTAAQWQEDERRARQVDELKDREEDELKEQKEEVFALQLVVVVVVVAAVKISVK